MTESTHGAAIGANQLLYLLYGDKTVYRHEAKFSILSALRHRKNLADFTITLMTDQPEAFDGRAPGGVTLQPLEARAERGERREGGGVLGVQGLDPLDGP